MKIRYIISAIGSLLVSCYSIAQDGNAVFEDLIENQEAKELLKSVKDNPQGALKAAQQNPDDLIRNATAIFAEQQKTKDPNAVPATRGPSQTDKALTKWKTLIATPVTGEQRESADSIEKLKKDLGGDPQKSVKEKLGSFESNSQFEKLKSAVTEAVPGLSDIISKEKTTQPMISEMPAIPKSNVEVRADAGFDTPLIRSVSQAHFESQQVVPEPIRNMAPTTQQIPDSPELFSSDIPAPQPLAPRYPKPDKFQPVLASKIAEESAPKPATDTMVITSSESVMDNKNHELTFNGDVKVEMNDMWLTCDTLVVHLDSKNEMERIVATGGTVEIQKISEGGKLQVAKARKAEHVAATNITTLSGGPPYLQNGDQYVNTDSEDSTIVLSGDGKYTVGSPKKGSTRNVIVVPIGNSKKITGDLGIDKKLNGFGR